MKFYLSHRPNLIDLGGYNQIKSNHLFRATRPIEKQKKTETDRNTETHSESQAERRTHRQN